MKIAQRTHTRLPRQRSTDVPPHRAPAIPRRRWRVAAPLAAALAVGTVALAVATGGSSPAPTSGNIFAHPGTTAVSAEDRLIVAGPSAALPLTNGDWRLDGIVADKSWFTGDFAGSATLTYTGKAPRADASFSVGVYLGDAYVGRLTGTVHALPRGNHAFVALSSVDAYESGPYHFAFLNAQ
jgi:hypothetical protein